MKTDSYSDCLAQLQLAVTRRGLRIPFPTAKAAIAHRHRVYRARRAYIDNTSRTDYNDIYIQLEQEGRAISPRDKPLPGEAVLVFRLHADRQVAGMTDLEGRPVSVTEALPPSEPIPDDLTAALAEAKKNLRFE